MKNSNDTIGNRNHDLPACSATVCPKMWKGAKKKSGLNFSVFAMCIKIHISSTCEQYLHKQLKSYNL